MPMLTNDEVKEVADGLVNMIVMEVLGTQSDWKPLKPLTAKQHKDWEEMFSELCERVDDVLLSRFGSSG
jgi:hypothetical protein